MHIRTILQRPAVAALALATLTACAPYGGAQLAPLEARLVSGPGLELTRPDALGEADGVRFHGRACRRALSTPTHAILQIERLGSDGDVVGTATRELDFGPAGRQRCVFYNVKTDWAEAGAVRVCTRTGPARPCASGA